MGAMPKFGLTAGYIFLGVLHVVFLFSQLFLYPPAKFPPISFIGTASCKILAYAACSMFPMIECIVFAPLRQIHTELV